MKTEFPDKKQRKEVYDQYNYDFFKPFISELRKKNLLDGIHCMAVHYPRIFPKLDSIING
ncbi:MAG: hypothetical protein E3J90_05060 [Promethearchaeota archaeon]|nr:MAG: hypothetical protein E3J90_05060 [Candidatus Lokiarchaeota archaeon]